MLLRGPYKRRGETNKGQKSVTLQRPSQTVFECVEVGASELFVWGELLTTYGCLSEPEMLRVQCIRYMLDTDDL
jgi:hypothetical protein